MAFQATVPLIIMTGALTVAGTFSGRVYKKRQLTEHSLAWETGLRQVAGVVPPRTHVAPFIAKPHPALEGREIPIYAGGALLSQIVPGGKLDPYANPLPTKEQLEKEKHRILSFGVITQADMDAIDESRADWAKVAEGREAQTQFAGRNTYRHDPMAEYYRIKAYQKLHPEAELNEERMKTIDLEKLKYWR